MAAFNFTPFFNDMVADDFGEHAIRQFQAIHTKLLADTRPGLSAEGLMYLIGAYLLNQNGFTNEELEKIRIILVCNPQE